MTQEQTSERKRYRIVGAQIRYGGDSGLRGLTPSFEPDQLRLAFLKLGRNRNIFKIIMFLEDEAGQYRQFTIRDTSVEDGGQDWVLIGDGEPLNPQTFSEFARDEGGGSDSTLINLISTVSGR